MKKLITIFVVLVSVIMFSCENSINRTKQVQINQKNEEDINQAIINSFLNYGRKVDANFQACSDTANIKLYVYSPSFIDIQTQKLILSLVGYELFNTLKSYQYIKWTWVDEGFEHEPLIYSITNKDLQDVYNIGQEQVYFRSVMKYLLNNMTQDEYLYCNHVIEELHKIDSVRFNFNDNFWLLIQMYTKDFINEKSPYYKYFTSYKKLVVLDSSMIRKQLINEIDSIGKSLLLDNS